MKLISFTFVVMAAIMLSINVEAKPFLGRLQAEGAKLIGSALAGTVVTDAFHAAGGDSLVNAASDWASGAANTANDSASGAWESTKNFFG